MRSRSIVSVLGVVLSLGCGHGSAQKKGAENAPPTPASRAPSAESVVRSESYGFEWRLPADWEFVPLEEIGLSAHPGIAVIVAKSRADDAPSVLVLNAREVVAVVPGSEPTADAETLASLEADASSKMKSDGIRKTGSQRLRIFDTDAIRVDGVDDAEQSRTTEVAFYRNRRRFTLQCLTSSHQPWTPCTSALRELVIHEMHESPQPGDQPRVLHLRDEKLRIQFDAPDDRWLAVGPRTGGRGFQVVWIWVKDGRQIDVQVMDLAHLGDSFDEATFFAGVADAHRKPDNVVTVKSSTLSGLPCTHIEIRPAQGYQQDLFLQKRGNLVYGLLVTTPERDQKLLSRAKAGVRIGAP